MTPLAFTLENAIEIVPDFRRRVLAAEARKFADAAHPPRKIWPVATTIQHYMVKEHERLVWLDAYHRRKARISRMKAK